MYVTYDFVRRQFIKACTKSFGEKCPNPCSPPCINQLELKIETDTFISSIITKPILID